MLNRSVHFFMYEISVTIKIKISFQGDGQYVYSNELFIDL